MSKPERVMNGDEEDAFSRRSRALLCCLQRAGVVRKTKQRYNRRVRHGVRQELRGQL